LPQCGDFDLLGDDDEYGGGGWDDVNDLGESRRP
jgi:hypothetical protein